MHLSPGLPAARFLGLALIGALLATGSSRADEPLPPPSARRVCSRSGRFCARTDPKAWRTTVVRVASDGSERFSWEMPGWFREASLSDDGDHLVVGFDGQDLLPRDYDRAETMLRFFERGRLIRAVRLDELVEHFWLLLPTVSHWCWGRCEGIDAEGRYTVVTLDGLPWHRERVHRFDVTTGQSVP
ncbi:hypothetical protein FGE12_22675 [Aggregicoccus sp. 17bor-14]|uniref:hypothetical protein n=1 Tax=Myxococcaceae TaxID=31 RepID=UPI00129C8EAB|nr:MULTISPECIES: hypothetical protein [Myxococcaceae]MBF5045227.1 hypothetical protein [Simulacricoccus sp. 17bor-14]MRI90968.1 hypothetical protein [Aggregicoccus sp. 17bor-14]